MGTTLLGLARNNKYKVVNQEGRRKTSHVTELLMVDMVNRRIRMTSIDCTLDMDLLSDNSGKVDHVISPMVGLSSSVIH
jgi:hypothetical protein